MCSNCTSRIKGMSVEHFLCAECRGECYTCGYAPCRGGVLCDIIRRTPAPAPLTAAEEAAIERLAAAIAAREAEYLDAVDAAQNERAAFELACKEE